MLIIKRRKRLPWAVGAMALVGAFGAAYWAKTRDVPQPSRAVFDRSAISFDSGECKAAPTGYLWESGARQEYRLRINTAAILDASFLLRAMNGASGKGQGEVKSQPQKYDQSVEGILNARVYEKRGESVFVGFQMSPVRVTLQMQDAAPLEKLYQSIFVVEFGLNGQPKVFHFSKDLTNRDKKSLEGLIAFPQLVLPVIGGGREWRSEERNATGQYLADYRTTGGNCSTFEKRVARYISVNSFDEGKKDPRFDLKLTPELGDAAFHAALVPGVSWVGKFSGMENLRLKMKGDLLSESATSVDLEYLSSTPDSSLPLFNNDQNLDAVLASLNSAPGSVEGKGWDGIRKESMDKAVQNSSLAGLMEALLAEMGKKDSSNSVVRAQLELLVAFLERRPDEVRTVMDEIKTGKLPDEFVSQFLNALEVFGEKGSMEMLAGMMRDSAMPYNVRMRAVVAAGGAKNADSGLVSTLWEIANQPAKNSTDTASVQNVELGHTALLSLGAISGAFYMGGNPSASSDIVNSLRTTLAAAKDDPARTIIALKALENAGQAAPAHIYSSYVAAKDPDVRAAALHAYRNYSDPATLGRLTQSLVSDEEPRVRAAALEALSGREANVAMPAVLAAVQGEPAVQVKMAMLDYIGKNRQEFPQADPVLKQMASSETSRPVAMAIYRAMYAKKRE